MGIFDKAILISDIDGTLLYDGVVPEINLKAIEFFKNEGGLFTVATGRGAVAAEETYKLLKCNAPAAVFQGGAVYDYNLKEFIYKDVLSYEDKMVAQKILNKFHNIGMQVHSKDYIYVIRENDGVWHHINYESLPNKIVNIEEIFDIEWHKVVFFCDNDDLFVKAKEYYNSLNYDSSLFLHTMSYKCKSGITSHAFEYYPSVINKGNAVRFLAEKFNRIPFTIGDFYNDVDLIKASKFGAATLEAPQEIKNLAKHITCSVKDGAVADYIGYIKTILRGS